MLKNRNSMAPREITALSDKVFFNLQSVEAYKNAHHLLLYHSFHSETRTEKIIADCIRRGRNVYLPVLLGKNRFTAVKYEEGCVLKENRFGIPEPETDNEQASPDMLDLIIVPGVAFDDAFHRAGYGSGYYDRYLKKAARAAKIGICYDFQLVRNVHAGPHDIEMDIIVTDKRVLRR